MKPQDHKTKVKIAMLQTVALLREKPELYNFWKTTVPTCGTPGCVLGHIGFFLRVPNDTNVGVDVADKVLCMDELEFYMLMNKHCMEGNWQDSANVAADALEKLAAEW